MTPDETYLSPWGTTTVPKHLCSALGLDDGARLRWYLSSDGALVAVIVRRYGVHPMAEGAPASLVAKAKPPKA